MLVQYGGWWMKIHKQVTVQQPYSLQEMLSLLNPEPMHSPIAVTLYLLEYNLLYVCLFSLYTRSCNVVSIVLIQLV